MSIWAGIRDHHEVLGLEGVWLGAKARLAGRLTEVALEIPGVAAPVYVRLRTQDLSVLRQVYLLQEYEWGFCPEPEFIVDAGANVGMTSIFYATRYPSATIVAVEPERSNFALLQKNVQSYRNVSPLNAALWFEDTTVSIVDPGLGHDGFRTDPTAVGGSSEVVPAICMTTLIRQFGLTRVDVLKVDIEGSEKEVFERSSSWINKVDTVIIELHDRWKPGCRFAVDQSTVGLPFRWARGETMVFARRADAVSGSGPDVEPRSKQPRRIRVASR